jgi:hypothetical protein
MIRNDIAKQKPQCTTFSTPTTTFQQNRPLRIPASLATLTEVVEEQTERNKTSLLTSTIVAKVKELQE